MSTRTHAIAVKSRFNSRLRQQVADFTGAFPEVCLILPDGGLSRFLQSPGALGQHAVTLSQALRQLADPELAARGLAPVNGLGAEAIGARALFRARREQLLRHFAPVAGLPGSARALTRTLLDLRLAGLGPEDLEHDDGPLQDLSVLLELYEQELETAGLADLAGIVELATVAARQQQHRWAGLPLAVLDVPVASHAHRQFLQALVGAAPKVLAAVSSGNTALQSTLGVAALDLDAELPKSSLDRLRHNLFEPAPGPVSEDDGRIQFFSAPGEGLEAVEIARRILQLAREGVPFDDCAVLLRSPERYQPAVEDAFRRAGIPAYFSRGATRPEPAGRAFLTLLSCAAENLSASRFAEYMSLGQVPMTPHAPDWVAPSDDLLNAEPAAEATPAGAESDKPTPRRWEQYLVDAAVIGGLDRWERRLAGLEAEWEMNAEENRERLQQLRNLREFALPLIGVLAALPRTARWDEWLPALRDLAGRALRGPEPVLEILAELEPMGEIGPVPLEEVREVLTDRLRFLRREPPVRRWGRVLVASIDEVRGCEFGNVFLPGLAEGLFPQRPSEDPLLLDELRDQLTPHLPVRHDRVQEERERLRLAAAAARERLFPSYPRMDAVEARPRVPSFYALEIPRAVHGALPELQRFEEAARNAASVRLNWPAPKDAAVAIDAQEFDLTSIAAKSAHYILEANSHAARSLRGRWFRWRSAKWREADGLITAKPELLALLEKEQLTARSWSPSSLENLSNCPYKFALHGLYKLRAREDASPLEQLDPATRGSLFHEVQARLYQELQTADVLPVTIDSLPSALAHLETVLNTTAAEFAERLVPAIPRVWESEIQELRTDLRGWLHFTAKNEYDWTPRQFELGFEVEVPKLLKVHGKIDSVEQKGDVYRVVDYKTGKPPETIPRWVGGGKYLQPLLYAIAAEQQLQATVEAGRLLYATQKGGYTPIEIKLDDRARQFLAKLLEDVDAMILGGFLPPAPEKDACKFCDYRPVCGPYEEERSQKKNRRDERLEPLFEIRGMA
ncbi:MAG: hypothetical protein RL328_1658 [Acidobacteriota bacterium]